MDSMIIRTVAVISILLALGSTDVAAQHKISVQQFEMWIFQNSGNQSQALIELKEGIESEITQLEKRVDLDEQQKEKIRLAGEGDIQRFLVRVEKARQAFLALSQEDRNQINESYQLAMPLQQELSQGLFGKKSLVKKVMPNCLTPSQVQAFREAEKRRDAIAAERAIQLWIAMLGRTLPMTSDQRNSLLEVVKEHCKSVPQSNQMMTYLIAYRLSTIDEDVLEPIFDEAQWKAFQKTLRNGRGWKAMLKQRGLIDE